MMGSRFSPPRPGRPGRRGLAKAAAALAGAGLVAAVSVIVASAAVPTFPDNLLVFPDRDFISVEGFQDHAGEIATVELRRGGTLMGSATGEVSGSDVAFEVNHPGGVCWGNGTSLKVTPDIRPGDVAVIRFPDGTSQDVSVQDAQASDAVQDGLTVTVAGKVGPGVNHDFMEQRIINPDLIPLIGKRDVRAVPGPLTPAPRGGYSSSLEFPPDAPGTFLATYVFTDPEAAAAAANAPLGERAMAWQEQDAAGNRQGMTIAEFGELGGPGFGGCPAGPADQSPPAGSAAFVRSVDKTFVRVNWTPVAAQPGAAAVTGYSVEALGATQSTTAPLNQRSGLTRRTPADAQSTTITGLTASEDYTIEVRSLTGTRMGDAFPLQGTATNPGTVTAPTLSVSPAPVAGTVVQTSAVTMSSTPAGAQLFYTDDGTSVIDGDLPSDTAKLYTGPISITKETNLSFLAIDRAGNHDTAVGTYAPPTAVAPAAPTNPTATAGQMQATLRWSASPTATLYGVQLYDGTTPVGLLQTTPNTTLNVTTGLTAGTAYTFTVKAQNAGGYGPESVHSAPFTPTKATDQVTIGTARWKLGDFRVTGTDSLVGATVSLRTGSATGTVIGQASVTPAAAPATGGVYDIRLRNGAAGTANPGKVWVTSSGGGVAGPFTVANG
jgi:Chitobiase/beta-hexosaminidase C-terminal domain/Fibronectin type III domain